MNGEREEMSARGPVEAVDAENRRLKEERAKTHEHLEILFREKAALDEALRSADQGDLSTNEKLRSANEKLEAACEELRAHIEEVVNEELHALNERAQDRNAGLARLNADLIDILCSVQTPILMLDRNRCIRRFTPAAERLLHLLPSDVGRPLGDMRLGLSISDLDELISAAIDEGRQAARELRGGDGRWYVMRTLPYQTNQGQLDGVLIALVDVHDLKQISIEALRKERDFVSSVLDAAPVMIWVSGPDKLCTFFNKNWLNFTGRTIKQELGNGWASGVHTDDLDRCLVVYSSSFEARQNFEMEYRLRRADGVYRWVLDRGIPLFAPGGVFQGYIGSCIDITDLKQAQEEALNRHKLESIGSIATGIAHDFNNLLSSIVAGTDVALSELAAGSPTVEEIQKIRTVALRASEIVRELMVYSGQEAEDFEPLQISLLIEEMVELLKVSVSKHVTLRTDFEKNLPMISGHASQIRQIVMNLIINASEAIGEQRGGITVTASRVTGGKELIPGGAMELPERDYVRLEVADTGCGITAEQRARIFDPFFSTKVAGRGMGLSVVHGAVRAHDGAINVISAPGRGTTFQIFFPCQVQVLQREDTAKTTASAEHHTDASGTLLIVEDEDLLRQSVAKILRKEHFSVLEAADGTAAIDLLRTCGDDIDLILLDFTIPGATSREVMEEAQRIRPGMKVIITSAHSKQVAHISG